MMLFMRAAKELCLRGLGDIKVPQNNVNENRRNDTNSMIQANSETPNVIITGHEIIQEGNGNVQIDATTEQIGIHNSSINSAIPSASIPAHTMIQGVNTNGTAEQISMDNCNINSVNAEQNFGLDEINLMDLVNDTTPENQDIKGNTNNRESGVYTTADGYEFRLELPNVCNNTQSMLQTIEKCTDNCKCVSEEKNTVNTDVATTIPIITKDVGDVTLSNNGTLNPEAVTPQYTVSNRGSLQLILNRYMYYCHHQSDGGRKRRWRCINYRRNHCPAFIDTDCEVMTVRKFVHSHSFHDDKIMKKIRQSKVFTNLNILIQKLNKEKHKEDGN